MIQTYNPTLGTFCKCSFLYATKVVYEILLINNKLVTNKKWNVMGQLNPNFVSNLTWVKI